MSFGGLVLTNLGRNELIKAELGEKFNITHIVLGDGKNNGSYTTIENLVNKVMELPISKVYRKGDEVLVECDFNSMDVPQGFYLREIGIIANGVLCYYDNAREDAEYIDPTSDVLIKQKRMRVVLLISSEIELNVTIGSSLYALSEDVEKIMHLEYEEAAELTELESGEKLDTAFGKIAKAIKDFISHIVTKASSTVLGHVKLTDSSAVTDGTGYALPATEKNASIGGTLANQISKVKSDLGKKQDAATAITTSNIGNQAVNKATYDSGGYHIHNTFDQIINSFRTVTNSFWSIVAVNGYSLSKWCTVSAQYLPNNRMNLIINAYAQTESVYGNSSNYNFTQFINVANICQALSISSLSFAPEQTSVQVIARKSVLGENDPNNRCEFSTYMLTTDGRVTRYWYTSSGLIELGNIYAHDFEGNIRGADVLIQIMGAIYT